jgi:hypothetical protein
MLFNNFISSKSIKWRLKWQVDKNFKELAVACFDLLRNLPGKERKIDENIEIRIDRNSAEILAG